MASLTDAVSILKVLTKDKNKRRKMVVPLDYRNEDILLRLDHCIDLRKFDRRHLARLEWCHQEAHGNTNLERLCKSVASALQYAIVKAELLRFHIRRMTALPTLYWSARHIVVSALGDVLTAFKYFRVVNEEPDLSPVHIRAMVREYLEEAFKLTFLFGKLVFPKGEGKFFFRCWQASLTESNFEDFRFDHNLDYSQLERPQMEDTNLSGTFPNPAQMPQPYLPYHSTRPARILNTGLYGPAYGLNVLSPQ